MKRNYKAPEIEIIELEKTDIIRTSADSLETYETYTTVDYNNVSNGTVPKDEIFD